MNLPDATATATFATTPGDVTAATWTEKCPACHGTGNFNPLRDDDPCLNCDGTGRVRRRAS